MIRFVNAKINIGLNITRRREDGYHELETVFYPVGLYNGTFHNPEPFCDILEITESDNDEFIFSGNTIDCPIEKNLVYRALMKFRESAGATTCYKVLLRKALPDGAGMGGGSADASFLLRILNSMNGFPLSDNDLEKLALQLGADCPVFIRNVPAYAEGIGEELYPLPTFLSGKWILAVKPDLHISTREAFAGVTPRKAVHNLRDSILRPIAEWRELIHNDFEESLFPRYPELRKLKEALYDNGALYASMTGSGAALYGIFDSRTEAENAKTKVSAPFQALILC